MTVRTNETAAAATSVAAAKAKAKAAKAKTAAKAGGAPSLRAAFAAFFSKMLANEGDEIRKDDEIASFVLAFETAAKTPKFLAAKAAGKAALAAYLAKRTKTACVYATDASNPTYAFPFENPGKAFPSSSVREGRKVVGYAFDASAGTKEAGLSKRAIVEVGGKRRSVTLANLLALGAKETAGRFRGDERRKVGAKAKAEVVARDEARKAADRKRKAKEAKAAAKAAAKEAKKG